MIKKDNPGRKDESSQKCCGDSSCCGGTAKKAVKYNENPSWKIGVVETSAGLIHKSHPD